ncbi:uncharacterized protein AAES06_016762 [Glossophaga mutica]
MRAVLSGKTGDPKPSPGCAACVSLSLSLPQLGLLRQGFGEAGGGAAPDAQSHTSRVPSKLKPQGSVLHFRKSFPLGRLPSEKVWLRWVFVALCTMEAILASSLAKVMSTASLAKAGGAVSGSVLAGLKSVGLILPSSAVLGPAALALESLLGTLQASYLLEPAAQAMIAYPLGAKTAAAVIGGAVTVGAVPVVLSAVGFTGAGIAASSIAAKMMSAAAIANGGGVAAGSLVATLQSVGAAGLSVSSKIILGSAGSALASLMV